MYNLKDATDVLSFTINAKDVATAKINDKNHCVVAEAVRKVPGVLGIEVGIDITRILMDTGDILRYKTPQGLANAARIFDKTEQWDLPLGTYSLHPPPPSMSLKQIHKEHRERKIKGRKDKPMYNIKTGRNTPKFNSRHIEFAKIRKNRPSDLKM